MANVLLSGKTALVTNVCSSLGFAIANRLGCSGAQLFVCDSKDALQASVTELNDRGISATGIVVDVQKAEQRKLLLDEVGLFLLHLQNAILDRKKIQKAWYYGGEQSGE